MAQKGSVFRKGSSWFLRYRDDFQVDGKIVRKQKCIKLADCCDRYRRASDLDELVEEKMAGVRQAAKCPHSSDLFDTYFEEVFLPMTERTKSDSTAAGYRTYWMRYLKPRIQKQNYALRDFTVAVVSSLLKDAASAHTLHTDTVGKIRSILSAVFKYAMGNGDFPGKSAADNPASCALIPEAAVEPEETVAATREEVQGALAALKEMPLERAAVALVAFTGVRPSEARGLRWEEWSREEQHIAIKRGVWHRKVGDTKTAQSVRFVTVTSELREILLALWESKGSPDKGYILAGPKGFPTVLDNMSKRDIRPTLKKAGIAWHGFYSLRRFHATQVRMESKSSETAAKALGNTKDVCDKHYIKPIAVLPDVREAVNSAMAGLVN
jgi:integrase